MLMENVLAFGVIGMLTSLVMGMVVSESKKPMLLLFLIFEGMFTGWLSGVLWVYLTGGLIPDTVSLLIPVFVSGFFAFLSIAYLPKDLWRERLTPVSNTATVISVVLLVAVGIGVAWTALPPAFASTLNAENVTMQTVDWTPTVFTNEKIMIEPKDSNLMSFKISKSSISGLRMMEEPEAKGYMDFQVTMETGALWVKPYLKVAVFQDIDGNGKLNTGDIMWSDSSYKVVLGTDDENWRANCVWENGQPVSCAFTTEDAILPIYHASTLSYWQDESSKKFMNTPEGYTAPVDMLSWEREGTTISQKENIIAFASIDAGQETTIKGKVYCQDATMGNHYIIIQAFDANNEGVDPIASKLISFQVGTPTISIGSEWFILIGLGGIVGLGVFIQRKEKWF